MRMEGLLEPRRQEGDAFPQSFAIADGDLVVAEVDVFEAQTQRFHQAQAAAVEQLGHETVIALNMGNDAVGLSAGEDDGEFGWTPDTLDAGKVLKFAVEDLLKKEEQSAEGLILGRGGNALVDGEVAEERRDLLFAHGVGMAFVVKKDEATDPTEVRFLGANAIALHAEMPVDAVEEFWGGGRRRRERRRSFGETKAPCEAGR